MSVATKFDVALAAGDRSRPPINDDAVDLIVVDDFFFPTESAA